MHRFLAIAVLVGAALTACGDDTTTEAGALAGEPTPPAVAEVVCEQDGTTTLVTPEVATQADGIHVRVDNRADGLTGFSEGRMTVPAGVSEQVLTNEPGRVDVRCWPEKYDEEPARVMVTVVDVGDHWRSTKVKCPRPEGAEAGNGPIGVPGGSVRDYPSGAEGEEGDPVEIVRADGDFAADIRPTDVVERAAYHPEQRGPVVRVVRDGEVRATAHLGRASGGGWLIGSTHNCL